MNLSLQTILQFLYIQYFLKFHPPSILYFLQLQMSHIYRDKIELSQSCVFFPKI